MEAEPWLRTRLCAADEWLADELLDPCPRLTVADVLDACDAAAPPRPAPCKVEAPTAGVAAAVLAATALDPRA